MSAYTIVNTWLDEDGDHEQQTRYNDDAEGLYGRSIAGYTHTVDGVVVERLGGLFQPEYDIDSETYHADENDIVRYEEYGIQPDDSENSLTD